MGWGNQFSFHTGYPLLWTNHAPYDVDPKGWGSYSHCRFATDGLFHHYAASWSGSGNTAKFYCDGHLAQTMTRKTLSTYNSGFAWLGADAAGNNGPTGAWEMHGFQYWNNQALSDANVKAA